ncbi:MAG: hypothetical protein KBD06_00030 [Candidatus Pacebacteria bacterium]|nr:hypothetical protein [Candidatus Paceibacterota bacterium]
MSTGKDDEQMVTILYRTGGDWTQAEQDALEGGLSTDVWCTGYHEGGVLVQATTPIILLGEHNEMRLRALLADDIMFVMEVRELRYLYLPFREHIREWIRRMTQVRIDLYAPRRATAEQAA